MKSVFLLQHTYEYDDCEETKIIGIYSSRERAEKVVEKYKELPGFKHYPDCFFIDEYDIDEDNWQEGFFKALWDINTKPPKNFCPKKFCFLWDDVKRHLVYVKEKI
jgi:homoserine kinase type II